ncbi:hypothetical protein TSAR_010470, partial [Trichomalopsis sarcophagae]
MDAWAGPKLLKRTINHKKWKYRRVGVHKAVKERQQKSSENIVKRKKNVKTNKLKQAVKKKTHKKQDFMINLDLIYTDNFLDYR